MNLNKGKILLLWCQIGWQWRFEGKKSVKGYYEIRLRRALFVQLKEGEKKEEPQEKRDEDPEEEPEEESIKEPEEESDKEP